MPAPSRAAIVVWCVEEGVSGSVRARLPCVDKTALFFSDRPEDQAVAKRLCGGCANRMGCVEKAVRLGATAGVWGGYTADEIAELIGARRETPHAS